MSKGMTIANIQQMLWEQAQSVLDGKVTPANANAVTNSLGTILRSVKLQMEYYDRIGQTMPADAVPLLSAPIS